MTTSPSDRLTVVIPLYNDWDALALLLNRIQQVVEPTLCQRLDFLIVDDCSTINFTHLPTGIGRSLSVLRLFRNVGHQKAIALGLSYLAAQPNPPSVVVMDADGEDQPEDIAKLVAGAAAMPGRIVFAQRTKRQETFTFQLFYRLYKFAFKLLTGKVIMFGNFSLVPASLLKKLVHVSEIWNHYPGGVIRSRLPYTSVPIARGKRLAGESKMNFVSLLLHGLSSVAVLMDTVAVRILLGCVLLAATSLVGIGIVIWVKLFTAWAIPGWASTLVFSLFLLFIQAFLISLLLVFIVLSYRTQSHFIPAKQYADFIERVERVY
jgi:polyisoprenyl-phosphate glycosyltransferase